MKIRYLLKEQFDKNKITIAFSEFRKGYSAIKQLQRSLNMKDPNLYNKMKAEVDLEKLKAILFQMEDFENNLDG